MRNWETLVLRRLFGRAFHGIFLGKCICGTKGKMEITVERRGIDAEQMLILQRKSESANRKCT